MNDPAPLAEAPATASFADGLRKLAAWLDQHPDLLVGRYIDKEVLVCLEGADAVREFAKALPGVKMKSYSDTYAGVRGSFGGGVHLEAYTRREQVCRRIVTGTREVPATVVPAHTEDIVEWVCDEPLLAEVGA